MVLYMAAQNRIHSQTDRMQYLRSSVYKECGFCPSMYNSTYFEKDIKILEKLQQRTTKLTEEVEHN